MPPIRSNSKYLFRKPAATTPSLGLAQSFWALGSRELSIAASLESACRDGFEYIEIGLREERFDAARALLKSFPVKLIAQGWAATASEATVYLERAVEFGAVALNMHLGHAYLTTAESADMISAVQTMADAHGMPLMIETHRGRLTQDLFRTAHLLQQVPDTLIALDVSHYLVAGETLGGSPELFHHHLRPLLERTALIHGRIGNGQSIQVPVSDDFALTEVVQGVWERAMRAWLANAPNDAVLIFEPELGPPPYAYTTAGGVETFSRTDETRTLVQLAQQAWAKAQSGEAAS